MHPSLPQIENLTAAQAADSLELSVSATAVVDNSLALLDWLPEEFELIFYDQFYPGMSDPGAYVTAQRKGSNFIYMLGNHGWSSDWSKQSPELLAAWLALNMKKKHPFSPHLVKLSVRKAFSNPWPERA